MNQPQRDTQRQIVLLGIGHTNAHILDQWRTHPISNAELVCISDYPIATYSGMLPAVLAGQKPPSAMEIDLGELCAAANARLIIDEVTGLNRQAQTIQFKKNPQLRFDALSIGIGSVPDSNGVNLVQEHIVTIKPMQSFLKRLRDAFRNVRSKQREPTIILIVGGGAAGIEISCCLPGFLKANFPEASYQIKIINRGPELISGSSKLARKLVEKTLASKNIESILNSEIVQVDERSAKTTNAQSIPADLVIWATGATPPPLLEILNLPSEERGFLATDNYLRIQSGEPIFAVGDSGTILSEKLPKAGVYAVREGPILWENLNRLLKGQSLKEYNPQRSFLRILNTGDSRAIAEWFGVAVKGRWVMSWKDRIDSKFVEKYRVKNQSES